MSEYILRFKHKGIIGEFLFPANTDKAIILLDGLPSTPYKKELIFSLGSLGYAVFYPRYKGTWESKGKLFAKSPMVEIVELLDWIKNTKEFTELYGFTKIKNTIKSISVIGASFGGSLALECVLSPNVDNIIAMSPPINYKTFGRTTGEQDLSNLIKFLKRSYGQAYQFSDNGVNKFLSGELINPSSINREKYKERHILIVQTMDDPVTKYNPVEAFAKQNGIELYLLKEGGHLSLTSISKPLLNKIVLWLQGKNLNETLKLITDEIKETFKDRLISILLYGSNTHRMVYGNGNLTNDVDMVIIFDKSESKDLDNLSAIFKEYPCDIQLQLLYKKTDFPIDSNLYSINTHGPFFISRLKNARAIYGPNPFEDLKVKQNNLMSRDLLFKIQQYIYEMRNHILKGNVKMKDFFTKKLYWVIFDYLTAMNKIDVTKTNLESKDILSIKGITKNEKNFLKLTYCSENIDHALSNKEICDTCLSISFKLYCSLLDHLRAKRL